MEEEVLFELSPYHVLMAAAGAAIFLAHWLPRLLSLRAASSSALLMALGLAAYAVVPGMPEAFDPTASPRLWERTSETVLIVVLFATGLRIDNVRDYQRWRPTIRLLGIALPATILVIAVMGWSLAGMTVAGAVLLGAALAPTDPVLAGYGFIGSFVAGVACRRVEEKHEFHRRLHAFSEPIEHAVTAILLVLLGSTLPELWHALDWRHSLIGLGLLLVIRPLLGWLSLARTGLSSRERWLVGFFGVRGVGSIYYLAYASSYIEFINEEELWALVVSTIFASAVIHGATGFLVERAAEAEAS